MRMTSVVRLPLTYSPLVAGTTRARDDFVQLHGAIYLTRCPASAKVRPSTDRYALFRQPTAMVQPSSSARCGNLPIRASVQPWSSSQPAAAGPPSSGYLMPLRFRRQRQASAGLVTPAVKDF